MIVCSKCGYNNPVQKFCGQCGNKLLTDDAISAQPVQNIADQKTYKRKRWVIGFTWFLIIWIFGSLLISILFGYNGIDDRYAGGISFIIGIVVMMSIGFNDKKIEVKNGALKK